MPKFLSRQLEAAGLSETLVPIHKTSGCHITEQRNFCKGGLFRNVGRGFLGAPVKPQSSYYLRQATRLYVYLSKALLHFTQGCKWSFDRKHFTIGC